MNAKRSPSRRLLRYLGLGIINLLVLVVVVAIAAPLLFDPNDYKDTIAAQVKEYTGRDLTLVGEMSFSVLPWLGVSLGEARLGNAEGFGDTPFARIDSAQVRVKLIPLFSKEVRMDTVAVKGLELNLARNAEGRGNWEDLVAAAGGKDTAPAGGEQIGADPRALAAFALGGVNVEDAAIRFDDAMSGERLSLTDVDLRTGEVSIGEPVDAELSLRFEHPEAQGKASGRTRLVYDLGAQRYTAEGLVMDAEMSSPALGQGTARARMTGSVTYDDAARKIIARALDIALDAPTLPGTGLGGELALRVSGDVDALVNERTVTSPNLKADLAGLRHGDLDASLQVETTLAANLETLEVALQGFRGTGQVKGGPLGAEAMPVALDGDLRLDLAQRRVSVDNMRIRAADLQAGGSLTARAAPGPSVVTGDLAAAPFALRKLLARVGVSLPPTRDPTALGQVGFSTRYHLSDRQLTLNDLTVDLDGSTIQGKAAATLDGAIVADLSTGHLDVDRYLPPESTAAPPSAAGALPVSTLRRLDADVRVRTNTLRYGGMDFASVDVRMNARDGRVRLNPLKATLYGGSYDGNILIDASGDVPVMNLNEQVKNVDAHALLAAAGAGTGGLDLRGGRTTLALKAQVTTDAEGKTIRASNIVLDGSVGGKAFTGGAAPVALSGDVTVDLASNKASLAGIKAAFAELKVAGGMNIGFAPGALSYSGKLDIARFNARALANRLGVSLPQTSDAKAFTAVAASAAVEGGSNRIRLASLTGGLDGSTITGDLTVNNFGDPAFAFDLDVDRLDANRYLPPAARGKAATPGAAATALPVDLVRGLKLDGTLKVGALTVGGVKMQKVTLTAVAKDGQLKLSPLGAALYGGRYDGNVTMDARGQVPRIALDETIKGIQIGPLLKDVSGDAPVTGTADLRAVLTASGGDTDNLKRTLDGDVNFAVADGALEKVDMVNAMCTTLAALDFDNLNKKTIAAGVIGLLLNSTQQNRSGAAAAGEGRTRFTDLRGSARLSNGVARNDDLSMTSPVVRVRGAGTVDLPKDRIDYRAEAELVQSCAGIGKRDLAGQIIPVNISGPIADPKVSPEIPTGLIQALRRRRSETPAPAAPAATAPAPVTPTQVTPAQGWGTPAPDQGAAQAPPPEPQPRKPANELKDARDDLLKGLLKGILK